MAPAPARRSVWIAAATAAALLLPLDPAADARRLKYWRPDPDLRKLHALQASGVRPDVLLLGSSRQRRAMVPWLLEREAAAALGREAFVFNAAQPGTGVVEAAWILRDLVATNGCPRAIVLEADVEGLNAATGRVPRALSTYASLADLPRALRWSWTPERLDAWLGAPLSGLGNLAYALASPPDAAVARRERARVLGWRGGIYQPDVSPPPERSWSVADRTAEALRRERWRRRGFLVRVNRLDRFRLGGLPADALERIAAAAERCEAGLVIVTLPTLESLAAWGFGDAERAAMTHLERFAARDGAIRLDLSALVRRLGQRGFLDLLHVNHVGAMEASSRLAPALRAALRRRG